MKRIQRAALSVFLCLVAVAGYGQSQDSDSETLKAILVELRAIHQDMQVTATTQLLIAEMQMQQAVVSRATETADNARERLNGVHVSQLHLSTELEQLEDQFDKTTSSDLKNELPHRIEQVKSNLDLTKNEERDASTNLQDMQQRLRDAQDKLAGIESELSAAIGRLAPLSK